MTRWERDDGWSTVLDCDDRHRSDWVWSVPGLAARLDAGIRVAHVGCGRGECMVEMAQRYPASTFTGIDLDGDSVDVAIRRVMDAGVGRRCDLVTGDAEHYCGDFDAICFLARLDVLGDPVGVAVHARHHLADDGLAVLVAEGADDHDVLRKVFGEARFGMLERRVGSTGVVAYVATA